MTYYIVGHIKITQFITAKISVNPDQTSQCNELPSATDPESSKLFFTCLVFGMNITVNCKMPCLHSEYAKEKKESK